MNAQRVESTVKVNILDLSSLEENAIKFINENVVKDGDLAVSANAYGGTHGIVETDEGTYYLCSEGVGMDSPVTNDNPIVLEFHYNTESGGMSIFPACSMKLTIDKIDEVIADNYVPLHEFIRSFGSRLEDNYRQWDQKLRKIAVEVD